MSNSDEFGSYIRDERQRAGLSLREVARRLNVSPSWLSKVERGQETPGDATIERIADVLGLGLDDTYCAARRIPPDVETWIVEHWVTAMPVIRQMMRDR